MSVIKTMVGCYEHLLLDFTSKDYSDYLDKPNEKIAFPVLGGESKIKLITLTDKGKEKAKQLLNVKL